MFWAYKNIEKCSQESYTGSAVTITIKNINKDNNNNVVEEVAITDGLSKETIEAIKKDIKRGYDLKLNLHKI